MALEICLYHQIEFKLDKTFLVWLCFVYGYSTVTSLPFQSVGGNFFVVVFYIDKRNKLFLSGLPFVTDFAHDSVD